MERSQFYSLKEYIQKLKKIALIHVVRMAYSDSKLWLSETHNKLKNLGKTNLELAIYHFDNGNISDAIFRLTLLKIFNFFPPVASYYLGRCYMENFKPKEAKQYLSAYMTSGDTTFLEEVKYCLKVLNREKDIEGIPISIVAHNIDKASRSRKKSSSKKNEKPSIQAEVVNLMQKYLDENKKSFAKNVLDLGCGYGTLGKYLREFGVVDILVGVDISSKMLDVARDLKFDRTMTYSKVVKQDVMEFLLTSKDRGSYDIVIATDLISYIGDVDRFMKMVYDFISEGGLFVISFRSHESDRAFIYNLEEFGYSEAYIKEMAERFSWKVEVSERISAEDGIEYDVLLLSKIGKI